MNTPTIHHPAETVCFPEYAKLNTAVKELAKAMETAKHNIVAQATAGKEIAE